jgi:hypothetical protein
MSKGKSTSISILNLPLFVSTNFCISEYTRLNSYPKFRVNQLIFKLNLPWEMAAKTAFDRLWDLLPAAAIGDT